MTDKGPVQICTGFPTGKSDDLVFGIDTSDPAYQPIYTRKKTLERFAATGGSLTLALFRERIIIGYAVIGSPSGDSRWAKDRWAKILELKGVEVARPFRSRGIAGHLLNHLFSGTAHDDRIVILSAFAWLWDMAHTDLSCTAYREMLINLYTRFGFESCQTNEPNVCLKPENIFMARIGKNISANDRERFKWLRFGIKSPVKDSFSGKTVENSEKNGYVTV
jgi:acetoin utilization protein AcuA